jgi:predicted transcriptional regulator
MMARFFEAETDERLVALEDTALKDLLDKFTPRSFHIIMVIDKDCNIVGFITEDRLVDNLIKGNLNSPVSDLLA